MQQNVHPDSCLDLFGSSQDDPFENLLQKLQTLSEYIVQTWRLPQRSVTVFPNMGQKGKSNEGKIVSYSLVISESDYPATDADLCDGRRTKCITFKRVKHDIVETLPIKNVILERLRIPDGANALPQDKTDRETDSRKLAIPIASAGIIDFFKDIVVLKLKVYESSYASSFGCCSLFEECSDAKRCIHPNRLYSTACAYRHNLESGRIFYGKNRNI